GWTDIFVNSLSPAEAEKRKYEAPNALYINNGDGTFREEGQKRGVAEGTGFGFATWMFDYDNDGDLDILATNFVEGDLEVLDGFQVVRKWDGTIYGGPALYKNDGSGHFTNIAQAAGFVPASIMGAQFVDMDLDGDLDVILGPGSHPLWNMQPLFMYRNNGNDTFTNVTPLDQPEYFGKFHGTAFADMDRDGDPDVIVNNGGIQLNDRFRDLVLENTTEGKNWLHVKLVGTKANRSGVGSRITARFGDRQLLQEVSAGEGFSSTNTPYLIFGLGDAPKVDSLVIDWMG
ncbi:MAG: CRTAC1 family protein, partial [Myxococcota bacterium]|nr:CRTAC1 family protein [Myxococcota bacterium]